MSLVSFNLFSAQTTTTVINEVVFNTIKCDGNAVSIPGGTRTYKVLRVSDTGAIKYEVYLLKSNLTYGLVATCDNIIYI